MEQWACLHPVTYLLLLSALPCVSSLANLEPFHRAQVQDTQGGQGLQDVTSPSRDGHNPGADIIGHIEDELIQAPERPSWLGRGLLVSPRHVQFPAPRRQPVARQRKRAASYTMSSRLSARQVTAGTSPLPPVEQADTFKQSLQSACNQVDPGARSAPSQLAIAGMPNTGSNALHQYLAANLNISVRGEPSDEIWKHRPPFHPSFRDFLEEQCRKPTGWVGLVVTVRHPLAWLLSQTSDGHHSYAHQCVHRAGSRVCVFGSCHISNFRIDTCPHVRRPGKYSFPTLLDLWASYASHLPTRLPTVLVTRYEELLRDPEAVLQAVSKHFGIAIQRSGIDPLRSYSRKWDAKPSSSGVVESRGRLTSFEDFWGQFGVSVTGRNASSPSSDRQTGGNNPVSCPPGDRNYLLLNPSNAGTLRSALDRNVLSRPLAIHNYMVPTADDASTAWETCKLRTAADRVIPLGYPTVVAEASKLPGSAAADEILDTLRNRCAHYFHGMKPAQLAVVGLPNSGSDALHRFLQDNLDMPVEPELPGLWKHLPVFHKRFQMDLLQKCLMQSSSSWTGIIFVVRHPLAWLQEQSKSGHEVGQTCIPNGMGDVECFFETCDRGKAPGCAGKPHRYITPHLLHLWGAYVDHLPSGLPPFLVVRYEDLLRDSDAVLREVVNHFKLEAKPAGSRVPLGSSMGRNVVTGAQQEWQNFLAQWQQLGVQSIVIPTPGRAAAAGQHDKASSTIECPQENYHDTLAHAQTLEALHVDTTRQLLSRPLVKVGYHLPTAEAAFQAREACAGGVGSNTTEWPRILHWHAISQEAANNPLEFG